MLVCVGCRTRKELDHWARHKDLLISHWLPISIITCHIEKTLRLGSDLLHAVDQKIRYMRIQSSVGEDFCRDRRDSKSRAKAVQHARYRIQCKPSRAIFALVIFAIYIYKTRPNRATCGWNAPHIALDTGSTTRKQKSHTSCQLQLLHVLKDYLGCLWRLGRSLAADWSLGLCTILPPSIVLCSII